MHYGRIAIVFLIIALAMPIFANTKAKVTTKSGKKWNVLFLKMSNDTIYLKAFKPKGKMFDISGHKSKFKKLEFSDGSALDLSLSDFTAPEEGSQPKKGSVKGGARDTVSSTQASSRKYWDDSFKLPDSKEENSPYEIGPSYQPPTRIKPAMSDNQAAAADSSAKGQKKETSPEKPAIDLAAKAPVEPPPSIAAATPEKPQLSSAAASPKKPQPSSVAATPKKPKGAAVAVGKKRGSRVGISLFGLSVTSFALSGIVYYFYHKDHGQEEETFASLNNRVIKGPNTRELISSNQDQHEGLQKKLTISQTLLGLGAAFLVADVIFYF